jgi:diguanylate cyclase (GGDEF)-like protein
VLKGIAAIVSAHIRDEDIFARWGGEEFVVLFNKSNLTLAAELAERLRKSVAEKVHSEVGNVTVSIGVVEHEEGESIADFVERADAKMYQAKQSGKNCVRS